jgi:hypothetical protein
MIMQEPTSKELYIMNGGQKLYIYKDGFGDVYNATPTEEAEWAAEIVATALGKIETEKHASGLQLAIDNLVYHKYDGLQEVLLRNIQDENPIRQIVFATALWNVAGYNESFGMIIQHLLYRRENSINEVFYALKDFKSHQGARSFLINCLEGDDDELARKAAGTIEAWAWFGMPVLKEGYLLIHLKIQDRHQPEFKAAVEKLKEILL